MADERLPFIRGRIERADSFQGPSASIPSQPLPHRDPAAHQRELTRQLDSLEAQVRSRATNERDQTAVRELVAVHPEHGSRLQVGQLESKREDARLVGLVKDTGVVLLDVADPSMGHIRRKVDDFADDTKVTSKTKNEGTPEEETTQHRASEKLVAPIEQIALATLGDQLGPVLRATDLVESRMYWFELACRGGYRCPAEEANGSRSQVMRQLHRIGAELNVDEFLAPERLYLFARLTRNQLEALRRATDCIYEVELAAPEIRDLKLFEEVENSELRAFKLDPPPEDAPAVGILDTGIATRHPLLAPAILTATVAGQEIPSPEDRNGHGTKMAGIALYEDIGASVECGTATATHWIQSSRLMVEPGQGTASDENYSNWPVLTKQAVEALENKDGAGRDRVFILAITRSMQLPPYDDLVPTLWSHAIDQLAYNRGKARLLVVSAGNARVEQWLSLAEQYPQLHPSEKLHQPAQATNALTVGAYTERTTLGPAETAEGLSVVAPKGGLSPFSSSGLAGSEWPIKPDVVFEGGNLAVQGQLPNATVPTLSGLTTSHRHNQGRPLGLISMTSEAAARAARLAARIWSVEPRLRPETVRGLVVHAATWTTRMHEQFPAKSDLLITCGYGVPNVATAMGCARGIATVIVEDSMPNSVAEEVPKKEPPKKATTKLTDTRHVRKIKIFRMPIPDELATVEDPQVELRVTLSYFPETNKFGRSQVHGLDLKWYMQGPQESESQFLQRINVLARPMDAAGKRVKPKSSGPFKWDIGIQARSRGTVQSDRWRGPASQLAGEKLIAVVPVLGWWERRTDLRSEQMDFSLVVSVFGPGVYSSIKPRVEVEADVLVEL